MNEIQKKIQIVVARYNENINWLIPYKDITLIYNKGKYDDILNNFNIIKLDNVGRESHTYLTHIINNYDNLSEKTLFVQGKISDHKMLKIMDYFKTDKFIAKFDKLNINDLKKYIEHIKKWAIEYKSGKMRKCLFTPYDWITQNIGIDINGIESTKIVWGANFSVSKDLILAKPKIFYENILRYLEYHVNPEEGHYLERSWYMIFNYNYIHKDKVGYILNNKVDLLKDLTDLKEIHNWKMLVANNYNNYNYDNINYIPGGNNNYLIVNPKIENNSFNISIKTSSDAYILIEFDNKYSYEILLGGWNNTKSIIKDYNNNKIIGTCEHPFFIKNKFSKFNFTINGNNIVIKNGDNFMFEFVKNHNDVNNICIKIKCLNDIFLEYSENTHIKNFLYNNTYNNIELFYQNYYLDYYVEMLT